MKEDFKAYVAYYFHYLLSEGCVDPKKVLIDDLLETVEFEDQQVEYATRQANLDKSRLIKDGLLGLVRQLKDTEVKNSDLELLEKGINRLLV